MEENYYWSDDFSKEFYIESAKKGFITTSMYKNRKFFLLPEIQFDYAIMDFDNIHISKKVSKLLKSNKYIFSINQKFEEVLERIKDYHSESWMKDEYIQILKDIKTNENEKNNFKLMSIEISDNETNELISGEIGYKIGKTYTSLTGFTKREKKYNNWGNLQLVKLNFYLKENGYSFWNLGHPQLLYKINLGAKIYTRDQFLTRWKSETKITSKNNHLSL